MYIPFDEHELIDQNDSTVDSHRSLSAESRLATDGNYSSVDLTFSLAEANDHTIMNGNDHTSMDGNGKPHDGNPISDDRVANFRPTTRSNDIYAQVDKSRKKKPSVDKIQPNIDEVRQQGQTYAVVNKTK